MSYAAVIAIILFVIMGITMNYALINMTCESLGPEAGIVGSIFIWVVIGCSIGFITKTDYECNKIETNIESALNGNYAGYTNYHHTINENSFVCSGKKYRFDYDDSTNTLTVFNETGTVVDGTYIDGQKQPTETVSETTSESNTADTSVNTNKADSTPVSENSSDLNRRIQSTILERYTDALITSYDTDNLSGTFNVGGDSYKFSYSDDLLEVTNTSNTNDVSYYKVAK